MAYFAIFDTKTGQIENIVDCPNFLKDSIHLECNQEFIEIESQISASKYIVVKSELVLRS